MSRTCSPAAITSFPLKKLITATDVLYGSVEEPITMDIKWASRSTPPIFTEYGITDEVGAGNTNLTTLRFLNNTYTITSVQIIAASHTSWILPLSAQAQNSEDIVMTFSTTSTTTTYNFLTFVIPLLRSAGNPSYLKGLSDPNSQGPFSLQSCFPTNPRAQFAYYATCLAGYSGSASTQNMYVFLSIDGISVAPTLITTILENAEIQKFGSYRPPFVSRLTNNATTIRTAGDFTNYVLTTTQLLNYNSFKQLYPAIDTGQRTDNTDAYKCVPLDPDASIKNGQLTVDIQKGTVLTKVLEDRDALRASQSTKASMDPGRIEKYLGSALGIFLSIIVFGSILYFAVIWGVGATGSTASGATSTSPSWLSQIPAYGFAVLIAGFLGFIIGAMLS